MIELKITGVQTICMRVPYAESQRVKSALGTWNHRNGMFLLIQTDEGITGLGEIFSNFPQWSHYEKEASVHCGLKPLLLGEDPLDMEGIRERVTGKLERIGLQWGGIGIANQILSGLDIALWDLRGKVEGRPVFALLGQSTRRVPVYCSGLGPDRVVESARRLLDRGVDAFKLKIGMDRAQDLQNLSALRRLIGPDRMLMADVNQGWDLQTALEMAPLLEAFQLHWVEEPLRADDVKGLEVLVKTTSLRIAGGENLYGEDFERHLSRGWLQVCQPDVTKCGGITRMLEIAAVAARYGVEVAPHFFANGVGYAATMHVMDAVGAKRMEYDHGGNPMKDSCIIGAGAVEHGTVPVPQGPGLGISLNEEEIAKYRFVPYAV